MILRSLGSATLLMAAVLVGCDMRGIQQQVIDRIRDGDPSKPARPGDPPNQKEPTDLEPSIEITNVQPMRGLLGGGQLVEIIGLGFEPGMVVKFGTREAQVEENDISANRIVALTPAMDQTGWVAVRVEGEGTSAVLGNAFQYYVEPTLASVSPSRGPVAGGTQLQISGQGLIEGTVVQFGTGPAVEAQRLDDQNLLVVTPPGVSGLYSVTVTNLNGSHTLPAAYTYYDPVDVVWVEPFAGPLSGGTPITVHGAGFVENTTLLLGEQTLAAVPSNDGTRLMATTLAPDPAVEGLVSVRAENVNGHDTLPGGFVFYNSSDPQPRLVALSPNAGLIAGGESVRLVVVGLDGSHYTVTFGTQEASCVQHDAHTLTCQTPPGAEGPVDVRVSDGTTYAVLPGGFEYVHLEVLTVLPDVGARAGNTYVRLFGSGFGPEAQVWFGQQEAVDVEVISSTELALRTPPHAPGLVDVRVGTRGVELSSSDAFTYINPFDTSSTVTGLQVEGSINVQVVNQQGNPVAGAMVVLGDQVREDRPHWHGFTDQRGEITLSGPDVVGPQNIHASRSGYGAFSFIEMNRANVRMTLRAEPAPPPDPLPECPSGAGGMPPILRGKVSRIKDDYNTGDDYVIVTTSYDRSFSPLPQAGPNSQMVSQGDYSLFSRAGDLVVIALAGRVTPDNFLKVHAMGMKPFVFAEPSSGDVCFVDEDCAATERCLPLSQVSPPLPPIELPENTPDIGELGYCLRIYDDLNVVIDTPLDQTLTIHLEDPPFPRTGAEGGEVNGPPGSMVNAVSTFVYYDFGYQGLHPIESAVESGTRDEHGNMQVEVRMPGRLPASMAGSTFDVQVGLRRQDANGGLNLPYSDIRVSAQDDPSATVVLTPLLKTPYITAAGTPGEGSLQFAFDLYPSTHELQDITASYHLIYDINYVVPCEGAFPISQQTVRWMVFTPGHVQNFQLPLFTGSGQGGNMPPRTHIWQVLQMHSPGASYHDFDLGQVGSWTSRSAAVTAFESR